MLKMLIASEESSEESLWGARMPVLTRWNQRLQQTSRRRSRLRREKTFCSLMVWTKSARDPEKG